MIKRTVILFILITGLFYIAGRCGYLPYKNQASGYYEKSEWYAYSDTIPNNNIVMVGSSLSTYYKVEGIPGYAFTNMSMKGKSSIDGINVIMASGKLPKVLLIETNIFDNVVDSAMLEKIFFPVMQDVKKQFFFTQRQYKLHHLLPPAFFNANERGMSVIAVYSGLYSNAMNEYFKQHGSANIKQQKDLIYNKNIRYHSTLTDHAVIDSKFALLLSQITYLQQQGVKIILFETPVVSDIYKSKRSAYKVSRIEAAIGAAAITYLKVPDNDAYFEHLKHGDGIHMDVAGLDTYQAFLNDTLKVLLVQQK